MKNKYYLATSLLLALFMATTCGSTKTIPDELIGMWTTNETDYRGTFFELKKDQISFGAKTGEVANYAITRVKQKKNRHNAWILYTVYYTNDRFQAHELPFYYQLSGKGIISFKNNPDVVWRKDESHRPSSLSRRFARPNFCVIQST